MNFNDIQTKDPNGTDRCELLKMYEAHEDLGGTLREFFMQFEFPTLSAMEKAIAKFVDVAANDPYYCANENKKDGLNARAASIHARFKRIDRDADRRDIFPKKIAGELWGGGYSRMKLDGDCDDSFSVKPDPNLFKMASDALKKLYSLDDDDMEKLHFFVEQCKARRDFPQSLRRLLYIWSVAKKTGKSTFAQCLVEVLNGDRWVFHNADKFQTTLSNEMQIGGFKVPLISQCNVAQMDECFYADMGKTYADFKRFMTTNDGKARLPYGQEFTWHGCPNYVATSNEPLQHFIKDWNDRRFLSIEFNEPPTTKAKDLNDLKKIVEMYVQNSTRTKDWQEWANEIAAIADEQGELTIYSEEFELELKKTEFLELILNKNVACNDSNNNARISLKFFVDYFRGTMSSEVNKHRGEIEKAATNVFGPKYSTQNYWRLEDLKKKATELMNENTGAKVAEEKQVDTSLAPF